MNLHSMHEAMWHACDARSSQEYRRRGPNAVLTPPEPGSCQAAARSMVRREMKILNLGCGTKISSHPDVLNVDWSIYLRLKRNRVFRSVAPLFVRGERLERFRSIPDNILLHDLTKRLPFADNSVDVVYHSHLLEHLDKEAARGFLLEVKRVLRPEGLHRIVVPDMETVCRSYVAHIAICDGNPGESDNHDSYIAAIIEQAVRKEAHGTSLQHPFRRFIENAALGGAKQRGETHQWMYDRINLRMLLIRLGYTRAQVQSYDQSLIPEWQQYGLDRDEGGNEYKPGSVYMEATK